MILFLVKYKSVYIKAMTNDKNSLSNANHILYLSDSLKKKTRTDPINSLGAICGETK